MCAVAIGISGCWPWHHSGPTPQEQYLQAISRGRSAQASQIWLNMSPQDRLKWDTGQGIKPSASPEEVKKRVMQHYMGQMNGQIGKQDETIENLTPNMGGGLQELPKLANPPPQNPPPASN